MNYFDLHCDTPYECYFKNQPFSVNKLAVSGEKGAEFAAKVQAESPVVDRWNEYMKDVMVMEMDPVTGAQPKLVEVFRLD